MYCSWKHLVAMLANYRPANTWHQWILPQTCFCYKPLQVIKVRKQWVLGWSHLNHVLDLFSGSCCRQQCAQSFHCDENVSYPIKMFSPFKEKLHFKGCRLARIVLIFLFLHEQSSLCSQPTNSPQIKLFRILLFPFFKIQFDIMLPAMHKYLL